MARFCVQCPAFLMDLSRECNGKERRYTKRSHSECPDSDRDAKNLNQCEAKSLGSVEILRCAEDDNVRARALSYFRMKRNQFRCCTGCAAEEVSLEAVLEGAGGATPAVGEPKPNC